jgi:hypothetical protein
MKIGMALNIEFVHRYYYSVRKQEMEIRAKWYTVIITDQCLINPNLGTFFRVDNDLSF